MGLVTGVKPKVLTEGDEVANQLKLHMNMINQKSYFPKPEVEEILLRQKQYELWRMENRFKTPEGLVKFTPSGASKCKRELFYKALRMKQKSDNAPFNNRWTRNSSAIHEATQNDLLYAKWLMENPLFTVNMVENENFGLLPAWEKNIETYKIYEHKGVKFVVSGMMDGLLNYEKTDKTYGFEYKTKTNDNYQVHKLKKPAPHHVSQCVSYSLIFDDENGDPLKDYILTYEAVAKDKWGSGVSALDDLKTFHVEVSERQRTNMLNKFAEVAEKVYNGELPDQERSKCLFCPFKHICLTGGNE
jgi:CRISPR/Cas system-associated exonuclease Cas4 (RecB family)